VSEGKEYGRGLRAGEEVKEALARFFFRRREGWREGGRGEEERRMLQRLDVFIGRLEGIEGWFARLRCLRFWSSSLLFIDHDYYYFPHEGEQQQQQQQQQQDGNGGRVGGGGGGGGGGGDGGREGGREGGRRMEDEVDVRMIDFAHVQIRGEGGEEEGWEGGDVNYMYGLWSLLRHLRELREEARAAATSVKTSKYK